MYRVGQVDPLNEVHTASKILRAAWQAPCLDYDPGLLSWHFKTPSGLSPISFLAHAEDGTPSVFVAAIGHRISVAGVQREIYISSFFSAIPEACPSLSVVVLRSLMRTLKDSGVPCLLFAQAGTCGEKMLLPFKACQPISGCQVFAGMARGGVGKEVEELQPLEWCAAYRRLSPVNDAAIVPVFDIGHMYANPCNRTLLGIYRDGEIVGCAMQELTRLSGGSVQSSLHHVRVVDAVALKALLAYCGGVTMLPNLRVGFPPSTAGVRATASRYSAFVVGDLPVTETWTEII